MFQPSLYHENLPFPPRRGVGGSPHGDYSATPPISREKPGNAQRPEKSNSSLTLNLSYLPLIHPSSKIHARPLGVLDGLDEYIEALYAHCEPEYLIQVENEEDVCYAHVLSISPLGDVQDDDLLFYD